MTGALYRLAHGCVRHRFVVLAAWLLVTVALVVVSHRLGDNTNDNLSLPGTDSQRATDTLAALVPRPGERDEPDRPARARAGSLTEPQYSQAVNEAAAAVAKAPNVASVVNPLTPEGASALSKDQATGYLSVTLGRQPGELSTDEAQTDRRRGRPGQGRGAGGGDGRPARPEVVKARHRVERVDRDRRRDGDPHAHLRHRRRDAAADPERGRRACADARDHPHARARGDGADGGAHARDDDRSRRGHRLRAVHRHAPSPRARRRAGRRGGDRARLRHVRGSGVLRRRHGHDRTRLARRSRGSRWSPRWA